MRIPGPTSPSENQLLLNKEQRLAVATIRGPLLIVAGAGSGKTRVITHRIASMLDNDIDERSILALTFTNKAAKEMRARIRLTKGERIDNLTVSTFHSFGVQILREWIHLAGYHRDFSIYDQGDKLSLLKEICRETYGNKNEIDLYALSHLISAVKMERTKWDSDNDEFQPVSKRYHEYAKAYNAVDFDDLITLPNLLFASNPEVLNALRDRYRFVLVDEFQDTSTAQYDIVKAIAEKHRNICVVGDDDQSIYSWRGASYRNIGLFEHDFPERIEIKLEQNYRSAKDILHAANSVIANNTDRKQKALWTGLEGERCIEVFFANDESEEANFIARNIRTAVANRIARYGTIGILVRTNGLMATIEEALLAENIRYRVSGGQSFFQRKEIKDLIAYLRVAANPDDNGSLLRIINTPRRGIGIKTIVGLRALSQKRAESLYSTLSAVAQVANRAAIGTAASVAAQDTLIPDVPFKAGTIQSISDFAELTERYRPKFLSGKNLAKSLEELVEELGIWGHLIAEHPENDRLARYKFRAINRFIEILEAWEKDPDTIDPTLFDFLSRITLISNDDNSDEEKEDSVNLMTIHAAKGLEFDVVFLAGTEENIIPHARAIEEDESNIEEERRLFYVAITRAKRKLLLSACRNRTIQRQNREQSPSPFLLEIPEELKYVHQLDEPVDDENVGSFFEQIRARLS